MGLPAKGQVRHHGGVVAVKQPRLDAGAHPYYPSQRQLHRHELGQAATPSAFARKTHGEQLKTLFSCNFLEWTQLEAHS